MSALTPVNYSHRATQCLGLRLYVGISYLPHQRSCVIEPQYIYPLSYIHAHRLMPPTLTCFLCAFHSTICPTSLLTLSR